MPPPRPRAARCDSPVPLLELLLATTPPPGCKHQLIVCGTPAEFTSALAAPGSLDNTLANLAAAEHTTLVFTPSLLHLRAYISTLPVADTSGILAVWGLVDAHRDTAEWSAQGLGRTLAAVVEAGKRGSWELLLGEVGEEEEVVEVLSKMIRTAGMGEMVGRVVRVWGVVGRWCRLEDWVVGEEANEAEEEEGEGEEIHG